MLTMLYENLSLPVWASDDEVKAELGSRLRPDADPGRVAELEAGILAEHHAARALYSDVMGGRV